MPTALVLGGAACVWSDAEAALALADFSAVLACNTVGISWPGELDAWVSLHAPELGLWSAQRELRGLPPAKRLVGPISAEGATHGPALRLTGYFESKLPGQTYSGSSSLFAVKVGLDMGFDRMVLAGCPMDDDASHIRDTSKPWKGAAAHRRGWLQVLPQLQGRVRSLSGWTRTMLGAPDAAWIEGA